MTEFFRDDELRGVRIAGVDFVKPETLFIVDLPMRVIYRSVVRGQ